MDFYILVITILNKLSISYYLAFILFKLGSLTCMTLHTFLKNGLSVKIDMSKFKNTKPTLIIFSEKNMR